MIKVEAYDPAWEAQFNTLESIIREATWRDIAIEHVGSTSVRGLASKPIIDIDVIVPRGEMGAAIQRLSTIGYEHRGNLGIQDREAFFRPKNIGIDHHLYVCAKDSIAVRNHLLHRIPL